MSGLPLQAGAAPAARPHALRRAWRRLRPAVRGSRMLFPALVFAVSLVPTALALLARHPEREQALDARLRRLPAGLGAHYAETQAWYALNAVPVQELRPLAELPTQWEGRWHETDRNYARFERWFSDHLGLRSLMIRSKNELDYQLFRSSRRVYYGKDGELYSRNLVDRELPATERLLADPARAEAVYQGIRHFAARLQADGITMLLVAPVQKPYYTRERLPAYAPHIAPDSHFMALSQRLAAAPDLHYIDVKRHLDQQQGKLQIFLRQDFHWTDAMAMVVAADTVNRIAQLEGSTLRWRHALQTEIQPFLGTESRFAARLNAQDTLPEPVLRKTWTERHRDTPYDALATGWEFHTDVLDDPALLPATCMFGNSFSDGMLRAGLTEHFRQFRKLHRGLRLDQVPALVHGQCKYLIVQVLDIQSEHWTALAQRTE